jgi:hypothetical protein
MVPTVVFHARDEKGNELVAVRVRVDGAAAASRLEGAAVSLDPGEHTVRYEAEGYAPLTTRVVVRSGEKNRALRVQLVPAAQQTASTAAGAGGTAGSAPAGGVPPPATDPGPPATGRASRTSAIVFGGIALAAFASEAYFGISGLSDRSALQSQPCAQTMTCNASDVDSIRTKFTVADISLGVGLISAGLATYLFFASSGGGHDPPAPGAHVDVAPAPIAGGVGATMTGRF